MIDQPRFSVLTTVFNPEPQHLAACLQSVDQQTERSWEHIVVDDASTRADVTATLDGASKNRRTIIRRHRNGGIVAASADALNAATGTFVVLLDHDDVLTPDALEVMAATIDERVEAGASADVLYSDHDILRQDGRCVSPVYKPDFSLERLRNHNYITHLVVARREAVERAGGFREGFDGAQDHDLLLRLAGTAGPFLHVSRVLLHWRQSPASVASDTANKPGAFESGRRAVAEHLERSDIGATVEVGAHPGIVRVRRSIADRPLVSVIVPTRGTRGAVWGVDRVFVHDAIQSLIAGDSACDLEIVAVIDSGTDQVVERGLHQIAGDSLVVVDYEHDFNFSDKINRGVAASSGEFLLLLNDDTQLIAPDSLDALLGLGQLDDVGMVGAKLLFEDGRLQHGGHVYNDMISHALFGWPGEHPGPNRLLAVERECSGVTAAAALLRRDVFDEVGAMNTDLAVNYNDVDLSLRVRAAGYRVIWTPHASWYHFEQQSGEHPIDPNEIEIVQRRWGNALIDDPFYNSNLAPGRCDWLERPLHSGAPPYEMLPDGRVSWG